MSELDRLADSAREDLEKLNPLQRYLVDMWSIDRVALSTFDRFTRTGGQPDIGRKMTEALDLAWTLSSGSRQGERARELTGELEQLQAQIDGSEHGAFSGSCDQICTQLTAAITALSSGSFADARESVIQALESQHMLSEESQLFEPEDKEQTTLLVRVGGKIPAASIKRMEAEMTWRRAVAPKARLLDSPAMALLREHPARA
jgi:hypothetical protein